MRAERRGAWQNDGMSDNVPTMTPRQFDFFSEWSVVIVWPNGRKQKVNGFTTEAHARGWIEHESAEWLANGKHSGS
jgi:hypothetical protein